MASQLAKDVRAALQDSGDPVIECLDLPDTKVPWPRQDRQVWPRADISGRLASGEIFTVETDDHADLGRSPLKYWPLLYSIAEGEHEFPRISYFAISSPDGPFGIGYDLLTRFVAGRFQSMCPRLFTYGYTSLEAEDAKAIADEVLTFVKR